MLNLYYDPIYTEGLDPTVRFPRERYQLLAARLKENSDIHIQAPASRYARADYDSTRRALRRSVY
jgi:hypothetical protein